MESAELYMGKLTYSYVLAELLKRSWIPFEYHRESMYKNLYKIKNIRWVAVDRCEYDKIIDKINNTVNYAKLLGSTYCHRELDKCSPNSKECFECYKYHCFNCGAGTNSYYSSCGEFRCANFMEKLPPTIYASETTKNPTLIYYFKNENYFEDFKPKKLVRSKETYGF